MKVRPLQSITAEPTTETQGKNNRPASSPQSLLTTKTLAEQSEKTIFEKDTEETADIEVRKTEAPSMTENAKIQQ